MRNDLISESSAAATSARCARRRGRRLRLTRASLFPASAAAQADPPRVRSRSSLAQEIPDDLKALPADPGNKSSM